MCNKLGIDYKDYDVCSECRCGGLTEIERGESEWVKVEMGSKITKATAPYYVELSNYYLKLAEFSADLLPEDDKENESRFKKDATERRKKKKIKKVNE